MNIVTKVQRFSEIHKKVNVIFEEIYLFDSFFMAFLLLDDKSMFC